MDPHFPWADALAIVALTGLAILLGNAVRRGSGTRAILVRRRLECPVERRAATVEFVVTADPGEAYVDVAACSLLPPDRPECGRVCRSTSVAPFSAPCTHEEGASDAEDTFVRVA